MWLAIPFWFLYRLTATYAFSYDGVCYALDVERGPASNLLHSNHLFYSALGRIVLDGFTLWGHPLQSIFLLQQLNALAAALAVAVFFTVLSKAYGWRSALTGALALGFSSAFWKEAVDPGCYALAGLMTCVTAGLLMNPHVLKPFARGVLHGLAILFHQMLVLTVPAFLISGESSGYWMGLSITVGIPYAYAILRFHSGSVSETVMWLFGPAGPRPNSGIFHNSWWSFDFYKNMVAAGKGFVESFVALPMGTEGKLAQAGVLVVLLFLLVWMVLRSPRGKRTAAWWTWIVLMVLFQFFWVPGAPRFRILYLPAFIILALETLGRRLERTLFKPALTGIAIMAILNFRQSLWPAAHAERNVNFQRAVWVGETLQGKDFFLFTGNGPDSIINVYVAYFAPRIQARSLRGYFFTAPRGTMDELTRVLQETRKRGGRIFMESAVWDSDQQKNLETFGQIPPGTLKKWLLPLRKRGERTGPGSYRMTEVE